MALVYSEKGMKSAGKIRGEFEKARYEYEIVGDEDMEVDEADEQWGYGELGGRRVNGEYELAVSGYGE